MINIEVIKKIVLVSKFYYEQELIKFVYEFSNLFLYIKRKKKTKCFFLPIRCEGK